MIKDFYLRDFLSGRAVYCFSLPEQYDMYQPSELKRMMVLDCLKKGRSLDGLDLDDANLRDVDLQGVSLRGTRLSWANLEGADLRGADLTDADCRDARMNGAKMNDWTEMRGINMQYAVGDIIYE